MKSYSHNDVELLIFEKGNFCVAEKGKHNLNDANSSDRANFEISISGGRQLLLSDTDFVFEGTQTTEKGLKLNYVNKNENLYVVVELEFVEGTNVITQKNTVKNIGSKNVLITKFSSSFIENVGYSSEPWYENDLIIHICNNKWQGECQWQIFTPQQLGLYPATIHPWERESFKIHSVGSWSTRSFYPIILVEDKKIDRTWFMETEGSHSWFIKICSYGGYAAPSLSLEASGCDESNGGWHYSLKPGEEYSTERTFFGIAKNGFEGVAKELNNFKRKDSLVKYKDGTPPVVFNDYMNCVWTDQSPEKLIPLIERAAEVGCEIFCIDDGWQTNKYGAGHGDWLPRKNYPLKELADKIIENGMIPGIWLELDACNESAFGYKLTEDCVLKRYDEVIGGKRAFYNFNSKVVTDYLFERIKYVYDLGFRFIKNDYNQSASIGCTNNYEGDSPAEGLIQNTNAFYAFIDRLYEKFPDLIIENCGSGGMREDNKILRHGMLQSTSDQEIYYNNPSIMMGSMAVMPPEKAGIWSYPYPALHGKSMVDIENMSNGIETSFNMVTSMFGAMYLSGRIDLCDEYNFSLIKEAIRLYKEFRHNIPSSRPVYPTGLHSINSKEFASFGLLSDDMFLLGLWNVNNENPGVFEVDLSKYLVDGMKIKAVYPENSKSDYTYENSKLSVDLKSQNSALFLVFIK